MLYVTDVDRFEDYVAGGRAAVRAIALASGTVSTVAGDRPATGKPADGTGASASFAGIAGMALDAAGRRLFVADSSRATIRVVALADGVVSTLAGADGMTGPADGAFDVARFNGPTGLSWSAAEGALYIADTSNHTLRKLTGTMVTTVLGDPTRWGGLAPGMRVPPAEATLYFPEAPLVVEDGGELCFVGEYAI